MNHAFLKRLNLVIYVLIALVALVFQSTIGHYYLLHYFHPDIAFIMTIYFGYRKKIIEGGILTLIVAAIMNSASSSGNQFYLLVYLYTFIVTKGLSKILVMRDVFSMAWISILLFTFKQLMTFLLFKQMGKSANAFSNIMVSYVPSAMMQAALLPLLFHWFHQIDLKTWSDRHSEDSTDINKEL